LTSSDQFVAFFVDGTQVSRQKAPAKLLQSNSPMLVGGNGWAGPEQTWQGDIDNVRIYSRALTGDEVAELYRLDRESD
jgi:hypothetical protein